MLTTFFPLIVNVILPSHADYIAQVIHHSLSGIAVAYAMFSGEGQLYTFMVLISEVTTPEINMRWWVLYKVVISGFSLLLTVSWLFNEGFLTQLDWRDLMHIWLMELWFFSHGWWVHAFFTHITFSLFSLLTLQYWDDEKKFEACAVYIFLVLKRY